MISCYFISYFSLRYYQVFSVENYFCDQFNPYINTGIPLEDNSSNDSKVLNFHDSNNISNTSYTTYFYFLPFDFIETSDNTSNVIWSSLSQSGDSGSSIIATQMNQNIPFKRFNFETKFISILTDAKIVINDPQNILSNQTIVFPYNFTLELGLQENGFVWLVLEKINTVDKNKKNVINILKTSEYLSKWQIIRGFNRTNQTAVSLNFQLSTNRYKNISISAFNLEPETNYGYFFMASNEETGNQRKYTDVYWNYFTTPAAFIEKLKISIILILICYFLY